MRAATAFQSHFEKWNFGRLGLFCHLFLYFMDLRTNNGSWSVVGFDLLNFLFSFHIFVLNIFLSNGHERVPESVWLDFQKQDPWGDFFMNLGRGCVLFLICSSKAEFAQQLFLSELSES